MMMMRKNAGPRHVHLRHKHRDDTASRLANTFQSGSMLDCRLIALATLIERNNPPSRSEREARQRAAEAMRKWLTGEAA